MADYCQTCYARPEDFGDGSELEPSRVYPGEVVCEMCTEYERHYLAQTSAEQRAEHEAIVRHCEEQDRA